MNEKMVDSGYGAFKAMLFLVKFITWPAAFFMGVHVLSSTSSGAKGFNFLGILFIVIGVMSLLLFCFDCATNVINECEELFLLESLCCGLPLYLLLISLGVFAYVVSGPGTGKSFPGVKYKEYELSSYSKWLQNKVNDTNRWENYYKKTLIKDHVCNDMTTKYSFDTLEKLQHRPLNFFESGCCKPSEECAFNYTSPTEWIKPESQNYTNEDCYTWSNDPSTFCFNCQSCKAAFAQDVRECWTYPGIFGVVMLAKLIIAIIIIVLYMCCKSDNSDRVARLIS